MSVWKLLSLWIYPKVNDYSMYSGRSASCLMCIFVFYILLHLSYVSLELSRKHTLIWKCLIFVCMKKIYCYFHRGSGGEVLWWAHLSLCVFLSVVRSLLRAGVQPTLDPSAETFMSVQCASPGRGGELVGVCGVCISVCLSTSISPEPHAWSLPNFLHVAYGRGSVFLRGVTKYQGKGQFWGFSSPLTMHCMGRIEVW